MTQLNEEAIATCPCEVHPDAVDQNNMNTREGHLGGYIMSSNQPALSGLDISNGDPATWQPHLWLWAISALNIRSVIDVGCAEGHAAGFFKQFGCDVLGIDGSRLAQQNSKIPGQHVLHDFTEGAYCPEQQFDMAWCSEFVEHVEAAYIENFLETFNSATRFVLMTHALPGTPGWHHVNCQPPDYWVDKLNLIDFHLNDLLTGFARQAAGSGHFFNSGLVFQKTV